MNYDNQERGHIYLFDSESLRSAETVPVCESFQVLTLSFAPERPTFIDYLINYIYYRIDPE